MAVEAAISGTASARPGRDQGRHFHDLEELKHAIVGGFASRADSNRG